MTRRPQQTNFIDITTAPAAAANHLAADILTGQPTTLPGPDDALQNLSLYRAVHSPPEDDDASGPVSPTLRAAAWRAAVRRASATEDAGDGPEATDARIRAEIAAEAPYVPPHTGFLYVPADGNKTLRERLQQLIADTETPYAPPAGIPDASPAIVDALGATPCERLEMANALSRNQRVRAEYGGRAQWQAEPPPDPEAVDDQERAEFGAWLGGTLREIACGFGIVAFVAVAAWLVFRAVTGDGP